MPKEVFEIRFYSDTLTSKMYIGIYARKMFVINRFMDHCSVHNVT